MAVCTVFLWFFIYLGCDEVGDSQTTGLVDEQWLDLLVDRPHRHTDSHWFSNQIMSFTKISSPELEERESVVFELHQATPSPDDDNPDGPEATPLGRKRSASSQSLPVTGLTANNNSHKELTQTLSEEEKPTIFSSDPPSTEQLAPAPKASWTRRLSAKMGHMTGLSINKGRLTNQSRSQSALPTSSHSSGFFQDQRSLRKTKTGKNGWLILQIGWYEMSNNIFCILGCKLQQRQALNGWATGCRFGYMSAWFIATLDQSVDAVTLEFFFIT